jgi:hypothetical protein
MRRITALTVLGTISLMISLILSPAGAVRADSPLALVSGPSPFAACAIGGTSASTLYVNAEVEPRVAINPVHPLNLIGVWQQDRWSDGGAHGLVTGYSSDGGQTWHESWAHFSQCAGGTVANGGNFERASDPWITFAPNGDAYQISLSLNGSNADTGVLVSKSTDGGATWSEPTTLIHSPGNDKESITADPTRPGYVYAVWDRPSLPSDNASDAAQNHSFAFRGYPLFSRTTDGGQTWSSPVALSNQNIFTIGNQIVVLPDGTLVDVFNAGKGSGLQPSSNQYFEGVMRSTDGGVTWSQPIKIANENFVDVTDPNTGEAVRAGTNIPDIAVNQSTGTLYAVWADGSFSGGTHTDVALSKSTDGGRNWSAPVKVNQTPNGAPAFTASVHVASDGTVGVTYYDFRALQAGNTTTLPTDYWLARSHDGGATWSETHVAGSFDMKSAPNARGYFLGDYEGLTTSGTSFLPFFVQANSGDTANPTDVFTTSIP